ncbi:MAG: ATP-binding protein [Lachnospiraceae bacterium]|nr:ATP-binding protein [Lachnospiraceae bacterium]
MLCQFSFQNFKSYKEETTFDLQATSISEFEESLIKQEKCSNLLPVSVIYGPNGGGKSNLLQALACLITTVVNPIRDLGNTREDIIIQQRFFSKPFMYDVETIEEPIEYLIFFRKGNYEYRYYLATLKDEIFAETLDRKTFGGKKPAQIFYREGEVITLGPTLSKEGVNTKVNEKMPYLSFLAINYNIPVIAEVQEWFESCIIRSYGNPLVEMEVMFSENANVKKQIVTLLNDMGIDIEDYRFDNEEKELFLKRTIEGKPYELSLSEESDGTRKLIAALPAILIALQEGRLVIIDELDAKLHPKLLRYVISLFKNPKVNRNGAQLLFTSHDMSTMKNTVFRRDEIWFAALNEKRSSEIYSLYEIRREDNERVKSTAAFDKQYLEGRYGADPYLQNMLSGGDWL